MGVSHIGVLESASTQASADDRREWRGRSARLYEELRRPAARMVRRAFGRAFSDDEIEDVYSSAWLGTLRALAPRHASLTDEQVRKYVLTAVAHHASKELRRRGRRPTAPLEAVGEVPDYTLAPEEQATSSEDRQLARDLLASLPPRRRAVMLLRYGCGLEPGQICALVKGLSRRAYRKEITRGIDELIEKMRLVERGAWCAEREPLLKAFAAGIASEEEARQARHHLSRCRDCSALVGRLTGHLHDLGGALTMPAALEGVHGGSLHEQAVALVDRARASLPGPLGGSSDVADGSGVVAAGGLRGGGAAGAGILTKIAGLSAGGKLVVACLAGGAVATTCAATGVLAPLPITGGGDQLEKSTKPRARKTHAEVSSAPREAPPRTAPRGGAAVEAIETAPPAPPEPSPPRQAPTQSTDATATVTTTEAAPTPPPTPLAPSTPPVQQQFGVPAATEPSSAPAPATTNGSSSPSAVSGGGAEQQEFGP